MSGETFVFRGERDDRRRWEPLRPGPVRTFLTALGTVTPARGRDRRGPMRPTGP